MSETRRSGNLHGKPALIVHGRSDGLLPVNHTSRPYLGFNRQQEGAASKLSYIEVENAQHFDAFIGAVSGYSNRYVPLHLYLIRALDAVLITSLSARRCRRRRWCAPYLAARHQYHDRTDAAAG